MSATVAARELAITNQRGLHARASAKFVKCAEGFEADIMVTRDGMTVPATSVPSTKARPSPGWRSAAQSSTTRSPWMERTVPTNSPR